MIKYLLRPSRPENRNLRKYKPNLLQFGLSHSVKISGRELFNYTFINVYLYKSKNLGPRDFITYRIIQKK
jgi:hypothetical protein